MVKRRYHDHFTEDHHESAYARESSKRRQEIQGVPGTFRGRDGAHRPVQAPTSEQIFNAFGPGRAADLERSPSGQKSAEDPRSHGDGYGVDPGQGEVHQNRFGSHNGRRRTFPEGRRPRDNQQRIASTESEASLRQESARPTHVQDSSESVRKRELEAQVSAPSSDLPQVHPDRQRIIEAEASREEVPKVAPPVPIYAQRTERKVSGERPLVAASSEHVLAPTDAHPRRRQSESSVAFSEIDRATPIVGVSDQRYQGPMHRDTKANDAGSNKLKATPAWSHTERRALEPKRVTQLKPNVESESPLNSKPSLVAISAPVRSEETTISQTVTGPGKGLSSQFERNALSEMTAETGRMSIAQMKQTAQPKRAVESDTRQMDHDADQLDPRYPKVAKTKQSTERRELPAIQSSEVGNALQSVVAETLTIDSHKSVLSASLPSCPLPGPEDRLSVAIKNVETLGRDVLLRFPEHLRSTYLAGIFTGWSLSSDKKSYHLSAAWKRYNSDTKQFDWCVKAYKLAKPVSVTGEDIDLDSFSKGAVVALAMAVRNAAQHVVPFLERPDPSTGRQINLIVFAQSKLATDKLIAAQELNLSQVLGLQDLISVTTKLAKEGVSVRFYCLPKEPIHAGQIIAKRATQMLD